MPVKKQSKKAPVKKSSKPAAKAPTKKIGNQYLLTTDAQGNITKVKKVK